MDKPKYFISLREPKRTTIVFSFVYADQRRDFLNAINKKVAPWDLYISLWEIKD